MPEPGSSGSLEARLAAKQAALDAERAEAERQRQETALAPTRSRIADLSSEKQKLEALASSLPASMDEFFSALKAFKVQEGVLQELRRKYPEAMQAEGIRGKADLLGSDEYEEAPEIENYRTTQKTLGSKAGTVRGAVKEIKQSVPDVMKKAKGGKEKSWQSNVVAILQERIKVIDEETSSLKLQTPEGQAEIEVQLRERYRAEIKQQSHLYTLDRMFIGQEFMQDAQQYGDDLVKRVLRAEVKAKIGEDFDKHTDKPVFHDIDKLHQYRDKVPEVRNKFMEAKQIRRDLKIALLTLFKEQPEVLRRIRDFGIGGEEEAVADRYIQNLEQSIGMESGVSFPAIEKYVEGAGEAREIMDHSPGFIRKAMVEGSYRGGDQIEINLPDLNHLHYFIARLERLYSAGLEGVRSNNLTLHYDEIRKLMPEEESPKTRGVGKTYLSKDGYQLITNRHTLADISVEVRQMREEVAQRKQELMAKVDAKFEMDWAQAKEVQFSNQHRGIERLFGERSRVLESGQTVLREIPRWRARHAELMDEQIVVKSSGSRYQNRYSIDFPQLGAKLNQLQEEIGTLERTQREQQTDIRAKEEEKRKKWTDKGKLAVQTEIDALDRKYEGIQRKIESLHAERRRIGSMWQVHDFWQSLDQVTLGEEFLARPQTFSQFLDNLPEAVAKGAVKVTPEQESLLVEYDQLQQRFLTAKAAYEALAKGRSY